MLRSQSRVAYTFLDYFSIEFKSQETCETVLRDNQNNNLIVMKQIEFNDQEQQERTLQTLNNQKKLSHQQLLSLLDFYYQPTFGKFIVFYEYCEYSLFQQFSSRVQQEQGQYFLQTQLWSIMTSIIFGLQYLQRNKIGHGSVSLNDVYLNTDGFVKVCDPTLATTNPFTMIQGYPYSPEMFMALREQSQEIFTKINVYKSDVFCLGCCILQMSLMREICLELYDYQNIVMNEGVLQVLINQLYEIGYSEDYIKIIQSMLQINTRARPDFMSLKSHIFNLLDIAPDQMQENRNSKISDVLDKLKQSIKQQNNSLIRNKSTKSLNKSITKDGNMKTSVNNTIKLSSPKHTNMKSSAQKMLSSLKRLEQVCTGSDMFADKKQEIGLMHQCSYGMKNKDVMDTLDSFPSNVSLKKSYFIENQEANQYKKFNSMITLKGVNMITEQESKYEVEAMTKKSPRQIKYQNKMHNNAYSTAADKQNIIKTNKNPNDKTNRPQTKYISTTANSTTQPLKPIQTNKPQQKIIKQKKQSKIEPNSSQTNNWSTKNSKINKKYDEQKCYTDPNFLLMMQEQVNNIQRIRNMKTQSSMFDKATDYIF